MSSRTPTEHRLQTHDTGLSAEASALDYIAAMGGEILGNRIKNSRGEIDIISVAGDVISFTEVKHRKTFDEALNAVPVKTWRRIASAAEVFMATRPDLDGLNWQYDLVVRNARGEILKISDAWRPDFY